jgi:hypothetical protein
MPTETSASGAEKGALMEQFGVLKRVDLRRLWPHEAVDFTTWLAQNIEVLGEALGLDLELRGGRRPSARSRLTSSPTTSAATAP